MAQYTAIVTGGNSGLGLSCAKVLARQRSSSLWHIIIATRSEERGQKAVEEIVTETGNSQVEFASLDLASLGSVREFAKFLASRTGIIGGEGSSPSPSPSSSHNTQRQLPPLKALILNAGLQFATRTPPTEDGFEATWQVNHLGHFLLVQLLLANGVIPLHIPTSSPSSSPSLRIIFVASGTHDPKQKTGMPAPLYPELSPNGQGGAYLLARTYCPSSAAAPTSSSLFGGDPIAQRMNGDPAKEGQLRYTTSKLCNVICCYEMARRLARYTSSSSSKAPHISVLAFDPGLMPGTGLARDYTPFLQFLWRNILPVATLFGSNINTTAQSGEALARLASDMKLEGVTSKYFEGFKEIPSSDNSYDEDLGKDLWKVSLELSGLTPEEVALP